ncbi:MULTISPECIES: four helix bundle protein [Legionella]|uniref:bAvd-like domain-containing protein n=3 Tax=Legionella TaxID=445 RepID=A0A0W0W0B0_9GAMM|nr:MULTISPECIES: four helix bundle protein [Legionella]HAT8840412.1 four helix bundle protein [Legionella pneumophila subsp. pneumophila]KTD25334.1 hypothetical protein Lmac_2312 [Legionella maceachernii]MCW8400490.1 four helix bundle protein [Legionella sp. PATHC038]MCZ4718417.1 four helix bundle protein [Legionella pneumophila]MDW8938406.1 four helix bundle protein [Legionella pneumophila]
MAFYTELPVYKDSYQLVLRVFEVTRDFPREYRYTLGQDMKRDALHLLRCIYRANKHQNRIEHLEVFLDEMELLKLEVRLCVEMKLISLKRQAQLSELLTRIGKQVTGWRNASRKPES